MKTVLFLIPTLGGGGAEKVLVNLANNLDKSKYDVTIQTVFKSGVNRQFLNEVVFLIEGRIKLFSGNVLFQKLFSPRFLYNRIIGKRYDIVVSYLESPTTRIVAGCPYTDSKLVNWIHTVLNKDRAYYCFRSKSEAKKLYGKYNYTACVSRDVKESFDRIFNSQLKCKVLYNTVDSELIVEQGRETYTESVFSDEFNVISVGRLIKEKAFERLVAAQRRLLDEGIKFHIYILGTGYEEQKLKQLIAINNLNSNFHLLGFDKNPQKYVSKADLFVCSSRREGFSTAVTEALILGVPVVSTLVSGAHELLGENDEYGIVTENSEEGVYHGLKQMLTNPELLQHYRRQAVQRGKKFSKENTVKAVERMFDSL